MITDTCATVPSLSATASVVNGGRSQERSARPSSKTVSIIIVTDEPAQSISIQCLPPVDCWVCALTFTGEEEMLQPGADPRARRAHHELPAVRATVSGLGQLPRPQVFSLALA